MRNSYSSFILAGALVAIVTSSAHAQAPGPGGQGRMGGRGGPGIGAPREPGNAQPPVLSPGRPGGPGRVGGIGPRGSGGRGGRGAGRFAALDLTDDQRAQVQKVMRDGQDQSAAIADELQLSRRNLHREVFADKRDDAKIAALATKVATLQKQVADLHLKTMAAVSGVLTPDQRQKMRIESGQRGVGGRGGRGGSMGPRGPMGHGGRGIGRAAGPAGS